MVFEDDVFWQTLASQSKYEMTNMDVIFVLQKSENISMRNIARSYAIRDYSTW